MSESSSLVNSKVALVSELAYTVSPSAPRARQYTAAILSQNRSTYSPGNTASFAIPARRNCYLNTGETVLEMTIYNSFTGTGANSFSLDNSAMSLIARLEVYHGSALLESINNYNVLASALFDAQFTTGKKAGLSASWGCASDGSRVGCSIAAGDRMTVHIPLLSGVVGSLLGKYLPLHTSDDLSVQITFGESADCVAWDTTDKSYSIISPQLICSIIELSESGMAMVDQVSPLSENIFIPTCSFRHYSSIIQAATGEYPVLVPARFASAKSLLCCPRLSTTQTASSYAISSRTNPGIGSYTWRIGSMQVPQRPVTLSSADIAGFSAAFVELQRSMHSMQGGGGSLDINEYNKRVTAISDTPVTATTAGGDSAFASFLIGQELESFSGRSQSALLSGCNLLSSNVYFVPVLDEALTGGATCTLDFYCHFDALLILDQSGLFQVRF